MTLDARVVVPKSKFNSAKGTPSTADVATSGGAATPELPRWGMGRLEWGKG